MYIDRPGKMEANRTVKEEIAQVMHISQETVITINQEWIFYSPFS